MAVGFRKSLFGFNCEDVINYIEKSHKGFAEKETELTEKLETLSEELELSNDKYKKLSEEKKLISEKLNSFTEKYEEIERLSENIGKLYLVAQANAQAIIESSEKNAQLANKEVEKNLCTINEAHQSLDELRRSIAKTSDDFINEVDSLIASLDRTREEVAANVANGSDRKIAFDEIYKSLVK